MSALEAIQSLPDVSHIPPDVYSPSDDTWLFCDVLAREAAALRALRPRLVVELGPGSGCVSTFLLQLLCSQAAISSDSAAVPFVHATGRSAEPDTSRDEGGAVLRDSHAGTGTVIGVGEARQPSPACIVIDINARACEAALVTASSNIPFAAGGKPAPLCDRYAASAYSFTVSLPRHRGAAVVDAPSSEDMNISLHPSSSTRSVARSATFAFPVGYALYEAVTGDLLLPLLPRLHGAVDVLLFNPPYVPTEDDEVFTPGKALAAELALPGPPLPHSSAFGTDVITAAWAGGARGRVVIDRIIPLIPRVLAHPHGIAYLVLVEENEPKEVEAALRKLGLVAAIAARRKAHNERLLVLRVQWASSAAILR